MEAPVVVMAHDKTLRVWNLGGRRTWVLHSPTIESVDGAILLDVCRLIDKGHRRTTEAIGKGDVLRTPSFL